MSDRKIKQLAKQGRGSRGVPSKKIKDMAEWLDLQEEIDFLFKHINILEDEAVEEIFRDADVICTTNSTAGSKILDNEHFDLLIHDEATQSTEPSTLIPVTKADKIVMAGDHEQLPPTILNEEAKNQGLEMSLFERLLEVHGDKIKQMLKIQYRMNQDIMEFPSEQFYTSELIADNAVKSWTLNDLNIDIPDDELYGFVFSPEKPVVFLDTIKKNSVEESVKDSKSFRNLKEAEYAIKVINKAVNMGVNPTEVALISPYKDQVDYISENIEDEKIEVDTVDGFQGREKEVIILSLVRTNKDGNIGFLRDMRRLNVSITRAKKKFIIIGDSMTVSSNEVYSSLIDYVKKNQGYLNL